MLNKFKTRITNPRVITGIVSGVLIILVNAGLIGDDMSAKVTDTVNVLLSVGVTLGIFADPESHVKE
jgi:uncharacterized membrane protein